MFLIMTINLNCRKILMPPCQKQLLTFVITHKNQDFKKAVLYGGGLFTA